MATMPDAREKHAVRTRRVPVRLCLCSRAAGHCGHATGGLPRAVQAEQVTVHFEGAEQQQFRLDQVQEDTGTMVEGRSKRKHDQQQSLHRAAIPPEEAAQ